GQVYAAKLRAAGILSFAQLAEADDARLSSIIQAPSWRKIDYASWREQARMIVAGAETELKEMQDRLAVRKGEGDDLKLIAGIGDKTAAVLKEAGITTFEALAEADPQRLAEICREAGLPAGKYDAWITQARMVANKRSHGIRDLTGCPQDLGKVKGIGSVFETRLYEAGIGTFWELANAEEDELRRILGVKEFQKIDLAAIKETARRLAEETHTEGLGWSGTPPDDFEPLEGIGPVFESRLYEAGICTYEALANATVEQLAEICKAPAWRMPDYASWIAQAKALLEQKGR
ncbi:MAG: helix-hairpin-helix domain-containing protein, partial [Anaerolineae bacterium]